MKKHYKFKLPYQYHYSHYNFNGIEFSNEWCQICDDTLMINPGYAWDGCSPKYNILGLITVGIPDGALRMGRPWTWEASLVHDVLCQFRSYLPLSKHQVIKIFDDQLVESEWPLRKPYVWGVDKLGPQDFNQ